MKTCLVFLKVSLVVIAGSLIVSCSGGSVMILDNLDQTEANNVILVLGRNNITAQKELDSKGESYKIKVSANQEVAALKILHQDGEPNKRYTSLGDVFKKDSFISSPLEEQARYVYALEQQISSMISQIDGVVSVSAQVSLPPPSDNLWQNQEVKPSASVLIRYREGYHLKMYANRIRQLVANSVPGLDIDHVEVMFMIPQN